MLKKDARPLSHLPLSKSKTQNFRNKICRASYPSSIYALPKRTKLNDQRHCEVPCAGSCLQSQHLPSLLQNTHGASLSCTGPCLKNKWTEWRRKKNTVWRGIWPLSDSCLLSPVTSHRHTKSFSSESLSLLQCTCLLLRMLNKLEFKVISLKTTHSIGVLRVYMKQTCRQHAYSSRNRDRRMGVGSRLA